jgi:hypothetical protein
MNRLQVFDSAEAACSRHGEGQQVPTRVVWSEKCLLLRAIVGDGNSVIAGFFGPYAIDVFTAHFIGLSLYFNILYHLAKLATSSMRQ